MPIYKDIDTQQNSALAKTRDNQNIGNIFEFKLSN